ncbi:uncharacterized protein LOC141899282 isoform X2 [Tubulanus polymorphus]
MFPMKVHWFGGNVTAHTGGWNTNQISIEFINYALALLVFTVRYPSVFWFTCRPFSGVFSFQLFVLLAQSLVTYNGFCVVYKCAVNRSIMPTVEFCLSAEGILILYLIASAILFIQNLAMFEYGYHYYVVGRRKYKEKYRAARTKKEQLPLMGCQGYVPHCAAMSMMLASMIFKAPINYDEGMVYRVYNDKLLLTCIIMDVVYLLFWIVLWFALTVKQQWDFRITPPMWSEDLQKNGGIYTVGKGRQEPAAPRVTVTPSEIRQSYDSIKDSEVSSAATVETGGFSSVNDVDTKQHHPNPDTPSAARHSYPPSILTNPVESERTSRPVTPVPDVAQSTMNISRPTTPIIYNRQPTPYNSMPNTPENSNPTTPSMPRYAGQNRPNSRPTTPNLSRPCSRPTTPTFSQSGSSPSTPNLSRPSVMQNVHASLAISRPTTPISRPTTPQPPNAKTAHRNPARSRKRAPRVTFEGINIPFSDTDDDLDSPRKGSESGNESSGSSMEDLPPKTKPKTNINNHSCSSDNKLTNKPQQAVNSLGALNQQVRSKIQRNNSKCSADYDNPYSDNYMNYGSLPRTKKQASSLPGGKGDLQNNKFRHSLREKHSDYYELKNIKGAMKDPGNESPDSILNKPIPLIKPLKVNVNVDRTRPAAESPLYGETGNPSSDSGIEMPDGRSVSPNYASNKQPLTLQPSSFLRNCSTFNPTKKDARRSSGNYTTLAALEEMTYPYQETAEEREERLQKEKEARLCSQV